jgi:hypothetical protein
MVGENSLKKLYLRESTLGVKKGNKSEFNILRPEQNPPEVQMRPTKP